MTHVNQHVIRNIMIIDDHPLIRDAVSELLCRHFSGRQPDVFIHQVEDGATAIKLAKELSGCLAMVDLSLSDFSGMELISRLRHLNPGILILVFSMQDEQICAERALLAGANGYLMKNVNGDTIIQAIQCISAGNNWLSETMKNKLCSKALGLHTPGQTEATSVLSKRELEIFEYIGQGLSRMKIKKLTGLSNNTIESHRKSIKIKLDLKDLSEFNKAAFLHINNNNIV